MLNIAIRRGDASPPFEPSKARAPAECAGGGCPPNPRAATLLASALDGLPAKGSFGPGADQFALDEGVGRLTVQGTEVYRPAPVEEGADIVERPNPFGGEESRSFSNDLLAARLRRVRSTSSDTNFSLKPAPRSVLLLDTASAGQEKRIVYLAPTTQTSPSGTTPTESTTRS